jgi:hypothetical protein
MNDNKSHARMVKIKINNNRIILENKSKRFFGDESVEDHFNYAVFQVLDRQHMRYIPFKNFEYLGYDKELPPINEEDDLIMNIQDGMNLLNQLIGSGLWDVWGQDKEAIKEKLEKG